MTTAKLTALLALLAQQHRVSGTIPKLIEKVYIYLFLLGKSERGGAAVPIVPIVPIGGR